jgi:hypothetical protein
VALLSRSICFFSSAFYPIQHTMSDETIAVIAKLVEDKYDSKEARLNEQRAVSSTEIARERWGAEGTDSLWDVLTKMKFFSRRLMRDDDWERGFGEVRSTSQKFEFGFLCSHSARLEYE